MFPPEPSACVIWDLDGTLLDTESLVAEVAREVIARHGGELTDAARAASLGKRPLEAWAAVAAALDLPVPAQQLLEESEALLSERWQEAKMLPGALRLLTHLKECGMPMALATSTLRATLPLKLAVHGHLRTTFQITCCGDEVEQGKPAPDSFLVAAKSLGFPPSRCLVIEDSPAGVDAAAAAGMHVVHVPSMVDTGSAARNARTFGRQGITTLASLLDFRPEAFGLPPFKDGVQGTVPVDPAWSIRGTVVRGYGRGSKELGIPTANLDAESLRGSLGEAVTGIYAGWASVGRSSEVYPMCMSVGFNPVFKNKQRVCEPWLLHEFDQDFYGEEIRLLVCAYLRPEADFVSVQALVDRIHEDAAITRRALQDPLFAALKGDAFLAPQEGGTALQPSGP
ncbi:Pseudouridine-5'-monophosphatase [Auxenochlorella protothecoides]|uniref:riboflavin kinase n=1 Tax=Auxenochlorella protothecoides TaxID=3075 RepID=A0A087SCG9_AUXPR|nr:Pseudouridine-5'-monophosphatase [Auxenochlorella protothecoides]KFM23423.1 Pseudouridine-5'-monophosphatase [Auxenochlorella protothecoides]RMZ55171.1 hypothetical protein APUTEX25_005449 [Auxenochlorella protothecoides]|eukprot:RMZ55171.1 hypothetical protein APUTEX25_005449 [Auxenochlorella protothecoides]